MKVGRFTASLVALGEAADLDLAVLKIQGIEDLPPLALDPSGQPGVPFEFAKNRLRQSHAVYYLFSPSFRDVEDLLVKRGIIISRLLLLSITVSIS